MKILHISPTFFDDRSFIGGGERYAYELARAEAADNEVVLLSFAAKAASETRGKLRLEWIKGQFFGRRYPVNPFSTAFKRWLRWADVIHCHQVRTFAADLALLSGKKVFLTDLGGGDRFALSYLFPLLRRANALLLISEYSRQLWEKTPGRPLRTEVIYGGVDPERFCPDPAVQKQRKILFVGRLLPHKGIDQLIDAVTPDMPLEIAGRPYRQDYFDLLKPKAEGKQVSFLTEVKDEELVRKYREAAVTVLPSVYHDCYKNYSEKPELLGLSVLESMACGTPAIVTRVASLPEIVLEGGTGFIVAENKPAGLCAKIRLLLDNPELSRHMGQRAREEILARFTWKRAAEKCLKSYLQDERK